ncbi:translation elongation factor Ts [Candidatus Phycorickettsia trachydisci]|nr:translation elongation factor Ts [Candidatus Phycorickettsia trachydisci]
MTITAELVNNLRNKTGAGIMDCKKALVETGGDIEKAIELLRKKGIASASKKAGRETKEGAVAFSVRDNKGVLIELNCETDFVARNENFQKVLNQLLDYAFELNVFDKETLLNSTSGGKKISDYVLEQSAVLGENLTFRRVVAIESKNNLFSYIHNAYSNNSGKIAVLVELTSNASKDKLEDLGRKVAMHIAAMKPLVLNSADMSSEVLQKEKEIFTEQAKASGKPEAVIEKMAEGRLRKFLEEVVLNEQVSIFDGKTKIKDFVANVAKDLGVDVKISAYKKFELGEIV